MTEKIIYVGLNVCCWLVYFGFLTLVLVSMNSSSQLLWLWPIVIGVAGFIGLLLTLWSKDCWDNYKRLD